MLIEYEFYYNLENVIAKPRNFTKIAGRITRIVANKELTLSDNSGDVNHGNWHSSSSSISRRLYIPPNFYRDSNIRWAAFCPSIFTRTIPKEAFS